MNNSSLYKIGVAAFIVALVIAFLVLAKNILVPLAFSFLLAYLLYPAVWKIERNGVHRIVAILIVIIIVLVFFAAVTFYFSIQLSNISIDLNGMKDRLLSDSTSFKFMLEDKFGVNLNTMEYYMEKGVTAIVDALQSGSGNIFSATATSVFQIFILPVFTFFILFNRTKFAYFIFRLVGHQYRQKAIHILKEVKHVATRYLGGIVLVVIILAFLNSGGLAIIGVPHAIVLGVGAALLNLIPYFGTLIGALVPIFYVLISVDDPLSMVVKVIVMFIIVQFLENNIITPYVVGGNVKLNPLTIIIGLLIGNLVWGVAGMLIIVPFLAILKIVMRNIDSLQPFAYLMSNKGLEKHRIHFAGFFKYIWNKIRRK